jgi:dolichol-phosphate mannosyltransferase
VCDDGSNDDTVRIVYTLAGQNKHIKLLRLSRNFGKELALTAGISYATGQAIITLDGDGQHPPEKISEFIDKWRSGAQVVVGIRTANKREGFVKKYGSKLFYLLFNKATGQHLVPQATDFCLISKNVQKEFVRLSEPQRITRGLISWLGFKRDYVYFVARARSGGKSRYNTRKLMGLAANSVVSLSPAPLYFFGYVGSFITFASFFLGITVLIEQVILGDPLRWDFTGTAMLSILVLFVTGIILMSQGILALYISRIHTQTKKRPLFIVDESQSIGF